MSSRIDDRLQAGRTYPLGAHFDGRGTHFAVFAGDASRVELCLFDAAAKHETRRAMPDCVDGVWHGYLEGAQPGLVYGYRVDGPYQPAQGHRFNIHKLLLDPYARRLTGVLRWHDALHGYRIGARNADLSFDRRDSAPYMLKAVVPGHDDFDWQNDSPPRRPWADTLIYEVHVRGFSMRNEAIPSELRGSFGGLGHPRSIEHLQRLGVTAVELLPIHAFIRERPLVERGLTNYWGYNSLAFLAPEPSYLSNGSQTQLKWAVRQLHAADIEVLLDVVYNHSAEGDERGTTVSLRGFGNRSYYRVQADNPRHCVNDTGCGNTLNVSHPRTLQLVMDSLRYWVEQFHVDGFRFDLAATLGRGADGFDPHSAFFSALRQDPILARVKLIAEPWDIGPGGYQLGRHPPGFAEWNDRFRDDVRSFWRGDPGRRGALAARLQGSAELFDHHRRRPWASVNFITAHDGFTLQDVVSYQRKHNEANGEENRDGSDSNESRNWGNEGPTDDPHIIARREQIKRSMLATLLFSHGTPMLLAGDEFGRTQGGNNNAYCQDNELNWLDWSLLANPPGAELIDFVARLIVLRRQYPLLRCSHFQHGEIELLPDLKDVFWSDERGEAMSEQDWLNPAAHLLSLRRAARTGDGQIDVLQLLINGDAHTHWFRLPVPVFEYRVVVDTHLPERQSSPAPNPVEVAAYSLMLLAARVDGETS